LRSKGFAYEFRTINTSAGTIFVFFDVNLEVILSYFIGSIKGITANDNTLLAAYSNGLMCLLDIRTGWLQDSFRPHESEILQVELINF
jgi:hypothetical protein